MLIPVREEDCCFSGRNILKQNREYSHQLTSNDWVKATAEWNATHQYQLTVECCSDGRNSDRADCYGIPKHIIRTYRSAGCRYNRLDGESHYYQRTMRESQEFLNRKPHPMAQIRILEVHYSSSKSDTNSCAAWNHDTGAAIQFQYQRAQQLNELLKGSIVTIVALIDTDTEAVTLMGGENQNQLLNLQLFADDGPMDHQDLVNVIQSHLYKLFPPKWAPLQALAHPEWQTAFYQELAGYSVKNVEFARSIRKKNRPVQHLHHEETAFFIGDLRGSWLQRGAFQIDDNNLEDIRRQVAIGFPFVAANVIEEAIRYDRRGCHLENWGIPIFINAEHDGTPESVQQATKRVQKIWFDPERGLEASIYNIVHEHKEGIRRALAEKGVGIEIPNWIKGSLERLEWRVEPHLCIAARADQLLMRAVK